MTAQGKARKSILLKGGHLVDPSTKRDGIGDILIQGQYITSVKRHIKAEKNVKVIDCHGLVISPAFCDAHVHLRTPGQERKETIITGCRAAARGGVTTLVTMPNTNPPVDNPRRVASLLKRYADEGFLELHIAAAVTKGEMGIETTDWRAIIQTGAIALTDDGKWVHSNSLMRKALEFGRLNNVMILSHAEDTNLHDNGCINRGKISRSLKVPGIPVESETVAIKRDIKLAEETGWKVHIQHLSTAGGVSLVRQAKAKGIKITCEVTPHHLLLNENAVVELGPQAKMNPPLRTERDRKALIKGVKDGTIDIIATDHAPHTQGEKRKSLREAAFGVTGLETLFSAIYTELVLTGTITLPQLIILISIKPRALFGLEEISLKRGSRADIVIIDQEQQWNVRKKDFQSRGKNSPFIGREFTSKILCTIHRGRIVFKESNLIKN